MLTAQPLTSIQSPNSPHPLRSTGTQRAYAMWLLSCAALVFIMVILGGATRLTGSGLSMVEWSLVKDILPPFTTEAWEALFMRYQEYPEFSVSHPGMQLGDFQRIFWLEYLHRLLGRLLALAFLLPLLWFAWKRAISRTSLINLLVIFALGALQAAVGWYMVKSGLVDVPQVSHLRLTAHLGLAVLLFAALLWIALGEMPNFQHAAAPCSPGIVGAALTACCLIFLMILLGGLVAGTKAGTIFNTFPLMNGYWLPSSAYATTPWHQDILHNLSTIQFNHRRLGELLLLCIPLLALLALRCQNTSMLWRRVWRLLIAVVVGQFALGVFTLLSHAHPLLSLFHQAGALLLLTTAITAARLSWLGSKLNASSEDRSRPHIPAV